MDDLWATKSEGVGLIVRAISFQDVNLCGHDPPTSQTDGQTDDMRPQDRTLHYVVHRAVNMHPFNTIFQQSTLNFQSWYTYGLG